MQELVIGDDLETIATMPIAVQCNNCRRQFNAPDAALGKTGACPNCGSQITIEPQDELRGVTTVTPERVAEATRESTSNKTVLIVASTLIGAAVLGVIGSVMVTSDSPKSRTSHTKPTDLDGEAKPGEREEGLGLTLDQFKRDVPIGESWKVLSETRRDDGTVSFQLISTTLRNVLLIVSGDPKDLREVSVTFSATTGQSERDTIAKITVMAYFLAKYSKWTEEELAMFWGRLIQVGAKDESEFRLQKAGHEFWMIPMGVKDGTMFTTGIIVDPDSSSPTLQAWLDDHPVPVGAGLNKSTVNRGQVKNAKFSFKGFRYKGNGSFIGEMTNDSNQDLQIASFKLSLYDRNAVLVDTSAIVISNFGAGQTRSFEAYAEDTPGQFFYKIDFENAL